MNRAVHGERGEKHHDENDWKRTNLWHPVLGRWAAQKSISEKALELRKMNRHAIWDSRGGGGGFVSKGRKSVDRFRQGRNGKDITSSGCRDSVLKRGEKRNG